MTVYRDIDETSKLLHTTPTALYSQRHRGEAPGSLAVKVGRRLLWSEKDLDEWWDRQRREANRATGC